MTRDIRTALPQHNLKRYRRRSISDISDVVIHHSAGHGTPESYAKYHISKGWPGIGYHYVIDLDGTVYYCNDIDKVTYHCQGHNTKSIGICMIGNYEVDNLDLSIDRNLYSLHELLQSLHDSIGHFTLGYHGQYKSTLCPGKNLIELIKSDLNNSEIWNLKA
jgi:hypothetical protein